MGRGASKAGGGSAKGGNAGGSQADFINSVAQDLAKKYSVEETPLSNSDVQAMVEAYAMTHSGVDEDAMMDAIRDRATAIDNVDGVNGYAVKTSNGENMEFYFKKTNEGTFYGNAINRIDEPTPNNMTERQMIDRIKSNGGKTSKYSKNELVDKEVTRIQDRRETNNMLNREYARNRGADQNAKAYRNTRRANRIARRNK